MDWSEFYGSVLETGATTLKTYATQAVAEKTGVNDTPATTSGVPAPVENIPAGWGIESVDLSARTALIYAGVLIITGIVLVKVL